jgi:outer membrane protein insertion porin family
MPAFGLLGIDFANGLMHYQGKHNQMDGETHFIIGQQF